MQQEFQRTVCLFVETIRMATKTEAERGREIISTNVAQGFPSRESVFGSAAEATAKCRSPRP